MAIEKEGNKTYAKIPDLPSITDIRDGDKFIVQTPSGTSLLDFSSLLIPLDNVSFKTQFEELWKYFDTNSGLLSKIGSATINVENLDSDKETLSDAVNQLNLNILSLTERVEALVTAYNNIAVALNSQS